MAFVGDEAGGAPGGFLGGPGVAARMMGRMRRRKPGMYHRAGPMAAAASRAKSVLIPHPVTGQPIPVPPGEAPPTDAGPVDPGFNIMPEQGNDYSAAIDHVRSMMGKGMGSVTWGGRTFSDPNKLWGWELKHGNTMGKKEFWRLHPDAARRLGMPVEGGPEYEQANPMDPTALKQGLIGQLTQAQGALAGTAAPGIHRMASRRMKAVGAAQGRAAALAQIMARRLRGRGTPRVGMGGGGGPV